MAKKKSPKRTTPKKRNATDATMRNVLASKSRHAVLTEKYEALAARVAYIEKQIGGRGF